MVEPGQKVGEYVLEAKIGQGSFGEVWRARHGAWDGQVAAVKIPTDPAFVRNLQREGISLHRLVHPNIVRAIGFDPVASPPYLMTEFVPGCSLRQFIALGKPTLAQALTIMKQVLEGLAYAHRSGMVHGDVKPENILIARNDGPPQATLLREGDVKITDFGLGLAVLATATGSSAKAAGSERAGVATLAYIAPEQRDGSPPDVRSDIFACGVVLFELLTGERPAGTELPSELNPAVSQALDDVFRRSYARRERRYASAEQFLAALDAASAILATVPAAPAVSVPQPLPISVSPAPSSEPVIGFKTEDEAAPPAPPAAPHQAPVAQPPPRHVAASPPASAQSMPPGAPRIATRPPPGVIFDQLTKRPIRTGDELRALFARYFKSRQLDEAESDNIRLRLDKWAQASAGISGFVQRISFEPPTSTPFYNVVLQTRFLPDTERELTESLDMANPDAALDCSQGLQAADYRPIIGLAVRGTFPDAMMDALPASPLKTATARLLSASRVRAGQRTVASQELKVLRATALSLSYKYQSQQFGICLIGESLRVYAPASPVMRMRDDVLKHAVMLLETQEIRPGIDQLKMVFEMPRAAETRAAGILSALRAKLAEAYAQVVDDMLGSLAVLESKAMVTKSLLLHPDNDAARQRGNKVRHWAAVLEMAPALIIAGIFGMIAYNVRPLNYAFIAAAVSSAISGLVIWRRVGTRMARTWAMFVHACLVPVAIVSVLATAPGHPLAASPALIIRYSLHFAGFIAIIALDIYIFRRFRTSIYGKAAPETLTGPPLAVLYQIGSMIEPDWGRLQSHYVELGSLAKFASAGIPTDYDDPAEPVEPAEDPPMIEEEPSGPAEDADQS